MTHLHELKKQLALKQITEAEYKEKEEKHIRLLLSLFYKGHITKEELYKQMTE